MVAYKMIMEKFQTLHNLSKVMLNMVLGYLDGLFREHVEESALAILHYNCQLIVSLLRIYDLKNILMLVALKHIDLIFFIDHFLIHICHALHNNDVSSQSI